MSRSPSLLRRFLASALPLVLLLAIASLCLGDDAWVYEQILLVREGLAQLGLPFTKNRLLLHLLVYGALGASYGVLASDHRSARWCMLAVLIAGVSLELLQAFVPERSVSLLDLAANITGSLAGIGSGRLLRAALRSSEEEPPSVDSASVPAVQAQ